MLRAMASDCLGCLGRLLGGTRGLARRREEPGSGSSISPVALSVPCRLTETAYAALSQANCIPRRWHPEGRHGLRIEETTEHPGKKILPLLEGAQHRLPDSVRFLLADGRAQLLPGPRHWFRGTPSPKSPGPAPAARGIASLTAEADSFTFAELFAGIGGFRVALESLGGRCVFASEIEPFTRELYMRNFGRTPEVVGDIRSIPDSEIPLHDMLVAGFPCQPFSSLGDQPGFEDPKGHGLLFREIVRLLKSSKSRLFLLENVPGLAECDEGRALKAIKEELCLAGYHVFLKTVNAKSLTAQSRKRIFFLGFRRAAAASELFQDPVVPPLPELELRASDVLESEEELDARGLLEDYTVSEEQLQKLQESRKWKTRGGLTDTLAWGDKVCATLVAHYGTSISRGTSQLVPRPAPHRPRRFSPRECARLMGFPNSFKLTEQNGEPAGWFRALYKMFGNAVSPPVVAVLAGCLLEHGGSQKVEPSWSQLGESAALRLALGSLAPRAQERLLRSLHSSWRHKGRD